MTLSTKELKSLAKKIGGDKVARGILDGTVQFQVVKPEKPALLELKTSGIKMSACKRFVVADEFRTDRSDIKLWMSDKFQELFIDKVEEDVEAVNLCTRKLLRGSRDLTNEDGSSGIIAGLGSREETKLYHLLQFLKNEAEKSERYLFYIRDKDGVLWAVIARWSGGAWNLIAYSVVFLDEWLAGHLVVSCEDS